MSEPVKLYCTQDQDSGEWLVWFPHPLGGLSVLEIFDNEEDARAFWRDQINNSDLT